MLFKIDTLKIGDYVLLKNLSIDGFFGAEGILTSDLGILDSNDSLEDAIFAIHLKRQYSASREYEDFISNKSSATSTKFLSALKVNFSLF